MSAKFLRLVIVCVVTVSLCVINLQTIAICATAKRDCVHKTTDNRRMGAIIGAGSGVVAGGGACVAGIVLAGVTWGVSAVVGCIGVGGGALWAGSSIGSDIGDSFDYDCPDADK